MQYYIDLAPASKGSKHTKIVNTWGLSINAILTSFSGETIKLVRSTETSSSAAIVEGYAKFKYLDNQWVPIWSSAGGVRAKIQNGVITTQLY